MTVLYRPVLVESAEQAEALPIGTIIRYLLAPTVLISDEERVWVDGEDTVMTGADLYAARDVWAVLVPIEAEEETREHPRRHEKAPRAGEAYLRPATMTRLVTPWREA